ncbi:putative nucleic acid-binding protein [Algoriphagus boseongensis]|uniref:Putative nucleic acid-binding protein n=1 Tax=Algoriphagus boseongensis TaxID=1442587 RepID=A0A4V3D2C6_9BACT|nr:PIN domain-containing protein [Algoriphagus boseongensis]TDQ18437.1 putative nucleic acid-binding protein [Algoriphagus boseongensis]
MKVFFDVNVILDFFLERSQEQTLVNEIFQKLDEGEIKGFISISILQTACYFLQLAKGTEVTKSIASIICSRFEFLEGSKNEILSALDSQFTDLEDAIHYFICITHGTDCILTNDKKFLGHSRPHLPILTPKQVLKNL